MKQDVSNGRGLEDRGPRGFRDEVARWFGIRGTRLSTLDMSPGRLATFDPGASVPRRQMSAAERAWLNSDTRVTINAPAGAEEERP